MSTRERLDGVYRALTKVQGQNHFLDSPLMKQCLDRLIEGETVLSEIQNQQELSGLIQCYSVADQQQSPPIKTDKY